ncbi:hypothetical protein IVB14_15910 [Bradyrhizobium sp. 180]|uniref:hypothetical protein n=1 Tax=unclassified Bradyrhizobium TaxID=2631580 RepID=UPI001FFACBFD|nr:MULTISPECIES: hypothetical protein [unclassified Bradyrhizobium]MCK1425238.1 hypothetical protein [Bradyrhizobium sp. CW12]MCK1491870.1 hypothetical protein [Bradyrhizobium sp. 180]MCK1596796.1 hypothetical protein [Bradyrhizobium sp. 164]MCK1644131.1 hypothetical protein [Bradyrhizobium sp. 154]MCK1760004.1 hypothetical protein [Bradyrhizobium sp. 137]
MKGILIGLIALAVLGAGGSFGFNLYAKYRATTEVEAAFEQIRKQGGKASYGKIEFDVMSRTLRVDDIAVTPGNESQAQIKIAGIKGTGVRLLDQSSFSADNIDVTGFEVALNQVGPAKLNASYKIPQLTLRDYAGPLHAGNVPTGGSVSDIYRYVLGQYARVTASSVTAPALTMSFDASGSAAGSGEVAYSGLAIQNLKHGKFDAMKADRAVFTIDVPQPGKQDKLTGDLSNIIVNEFDATAIAAVLDPDKTGDDGYYRVYRQISAGPYVLKSTQGMRMDIDGITFEDVAAQPSKFRPAEIVALMPTDRSVLPTSAQSREMMEKLAGFYDGLRIGKIQVGKTSISMPQGTARINAVRYRGGEFAIEGVDTPTPQGQFKMERFALKSFSAANLMRWAAGFSNHGQAPSPDQVLGLFRVLEGAEIKGVVAPDKNTKRLITIDTMTLEWGQLIGSIPSKAHLIAKFVTPTDPSDPKQLPLVLSGIDKLAIDLDLGAAWTESSNSFNLTPATLDIGGIASAQLRITLSNVPRELFSADPAQFMGRAAQVEAVALEFSVRDNGFVDSAVTQNARGRNVSRDEARRTFVDSVRAYRADVAAANPEAGTAVDAIASFVETPGQTLVIKVTPRTKVPLMQLMQLFNADPEGTLAQFKIEASTGL